MASIRGHFKRSGRKLVPKKTFDSEEEARVFMDSNGIKGKNIYKCEWCGKYHIGG